MKWCNRRRCYGGWTVFTSLAALLFSVGCSPEALQALANASLPKAVEFVRSDAFAPTPSATTSAADLEGTDELEVADIEGCWGWRESGENPDPAQLTSGFVVYEAFVVTGLEFDRQTLTELDGQRVLLATERGTLAKVGEHGIRLTGSNDSTVLTALRDPPLPPGHRESSASQEVLVAIEDDLMTLIWVMRDGSENAITYRRFECP